MVQVTVLSANGDKRTLKTTAFTATAATGLLVAKALRKTKAAEVICSYAYKESTLVVWGWKEGKAGTENKHELPPDADGSEAPLLFGDAVVLDTSGDFSVEQYSAFYEEALGGFEDLGSEEEEEEEEEEAEVEEAEVEEEEAEAEEEEAEAEEEEAEEEEAEEEDADDDCYDDGDENGGGSKRRAPRRRAIASPEYRRIDMGLRARVKFPTPIGKRAPKWQTEDELEAEEY
jgi:hypothetical protein